MLLICFCALCQILEDMGEQQLSRHSELFDTDEEAQQSNVWKIEMLKILESILERLEA